MQNVDVLYLSKDNRSTNIVCIDGKKTNIDKLLNNVLDELCYQSLSTFNGMVEAINHIYDIHNYVPLYLNEDLILQPIYPKKYWTQIYINITMIKDIIPNNDNTTIIFIDNTSLDVEIATKKFKQLVDQCLKIKNDQLKKERNNIIWQRKI